MNVVDKEKEEEEEKSGNDGRRWSRTAMTNKDLIESFTTLKKSVGWERTWLV